MRTGTLSNLSSRNVQTALRNHVDKGALILTDEHRSFQGLAGDYMHHTVNHSAGEYVRKAYIHTNWIESVWALFKRQIIGTHHWLSPKHLSRYLNEMTWRFDQRDTDEGDPVNVL